MAYRVNEKLKNRLKTIGVSMGAVFAVAAIIAGIGRAGLIYSAFSQNSGNREIMDFYAGSATVEPTPGDYTTGWWSVFNAQGQPQLPADADIDQFDEDNSAFYRGGNYSIVCSDFLADNGQTDSGSPVATSSRTQSGPASGDNIADPAPGTGLDNTGTSSGSQADNSIVGGGSMESGATTTTSDKQGTDYNDGNGATATPTIDILSGEDDDNNHIEILNYNEKDADVEIDDGTKTGSSTADNLISWVKQAAFNAFEFLGARAQTEDRSSVGSNRPGEFILAKIKFSLASVFFQSESTTSTATSEEQSTLIQTGGPDNSSTTVNYGNIEDSDNAIETDNGASEPAEDGAGNINGGQIDNNSQFDVQPAQKNNINSDDKENAAGGTETEETGPITATPWLNWLGFAEARAQSLPHIVIWYSVGTTTNPRWQKLGVIGKDKLSNALNNGYLSYDAPLIGSWDDIASLKIKLEGRTPDNQSFVTYLDSVWVEAAYSDNPVAEKTDTGLPGTLELVSDRLEFGVNDNGELDFRYLKNKTGILDKVGETLGLVSYWQNIKINAVIIDSDKNELNIPLTLIFKENGEFTVKWPKMGRNLKPGEYSLSFKIEDDSGQETAVMEPSQEFLWGVLALNMDKSSYLPGDTAFLQMAVLDGSGHTVCNADLVLRVTNPATGAITTLTTAENTIIKNPECGPDSITGAPDYSAQVSLSAMGDYALDLAAKTAAGSESISDTIVVSGGEPFSVARSGPTRIYPKADYEMETTVTAAEDFKGDITETVPAGFKISNYELRMSNDKTKDPFGGDYKYSETVVGEDKRLLWHDVELVAGDKLEISYVFDAPDISPELYLVGPLELKNVIGNRRSVIENRQWQIASDAVTKRARTVMFPAGVYNGGATAGNNTNTDYAFSAFNFRLAETGVNIEDAYVVFETQFEAYNNSGGDYTGYKLYFDSCAESCSADALGTGDGQVVEDDNTILAYDEAESNQVRLLFDVANETQLAAYSGNNTEMLAQVGYQIKNGTSKTAIANAKAVLVLTYTYDADAPAITNTVVYPLASTNGTDSGSRQASIGGCTRNNNCPIFDYNMSIPELTDSNNRLTYWFKMYEANDSNGATDLDPNVNIQTFDANSDTFHYECNNGGTQGNMPAMYFPDWASSGFTENTSQQLEYYINTGTNYTVGGEIAETYIASSSAATKTRTVSFPIGVISNGMTTSPASAETTVYFPENGSGSGTVTVKSAWIRLVTNNYNNGNASVAVTTKVGINTTSGSRSYAYNGGNTVINPVINIIHIIPSGDYSELEQANAVSGKIVRVNTTLSSTNYGGISAELMITYTYTDETNGYLTSLNLNGGQSLVNPVIATTTATARAVMPEPAGKTVRAAGLFSSFLNSDNTGDVPSGSVFHFDAGLATGNPSCSAAYNARPDDVNSYGEFYKNVLSAMNTTDGQAYNACYADDEPLGSTDGAKMNGQLIYTYQYVNVRPTGSFVSAVQKGDGSGTADIAIAVNDGNFDDCRARIDYTAGTACDFTTPLDPNLDETDTNVTATHGDPELLNSETYQVGVSGAYILTDAGANTVNFDWLAPSNLGAV